MRTLPIYHSGGNAHITTPDKAINHKITPKSAPQLHKCFIKVSA